MIPLTGYADRLSARPGERLSFKISAAADGPCRARLVRIISGDPNPDGPGLLEEDLGAVFATEFASRTQSHALGSYGVVPGGVVDPEAPLTLSATVWPTLRQGRIGDLQIVLSTLGAGRTGLALALDASGAACLIVARGGETARIACAKPLVLRRWARIGASFSPATGEALVWQEALEKPLGVNGLTEARGSFSTGALSHGERWYIAALGPDAETGRVEGRFNGKIEAPGLHEGVAEDGTPTGAPIALWDFAEGISTTRITDTGPGGLHGGLINMPARAMTGSLWTGGEMDWRHAPEQFAAVHFHDDDLTDCGWATDFTFELPEDLKSGIYGMRLEAGDETDTIPFFVPAPKGKRQADLCILIPTFTYVVYTNFDRPDFDDSYRDRARELGMTRHFPGDHPEYGFSTYNTHSDGSGICHSSPLRPAITIRPAFMNQNDPHGSGHRHFAADTHLIAWLEAKGIAYDIVTDHDIDEDPDCIREYRCVMTTSHPEYHTEASWDALMAYRNGGGRFCYLGGNGFYWRVARHPERPEVIEIRRGEGGIRAWASEPGEYFNAFDGAYGGLWRRQGRPPQMLGGVGFSAQGTFEGSHYRLTGGARDPRAAWIFEGVEGPILGNYGLSGGGAAGFELDRVDTRLGSPEHTLVLARSEGHSSNFVLVHEEQLTHLTTLPGEPAPDLIRAELAFFETPAGGAVFATGSITFCGALPVNGFDNDVSRMMQNVVTRFLDPAPFAMP